MGLPQFAMQVSMHVGPKSTACASVQTFASHASLLKRLALMRWQTTQSPKQRWLTALLVGMARQCAGLGLSFLLILSLAHGSKLTPLLSVGQRVVDQVCWNAHYLRMRKLDR